MYKSAHHPGTQLWCEGLGKYVSELVENDSVVELQETEKRWHLGASEIGNPCSRALWYGFRWATDIRHTGQLLRLFRRGHSEEPKFVHRLRRIGIHVWETDPNSTPDPVTGEFKQWRVSHPRNRHYGGSLDAKLWVPFVPPEFQYMLGEFKTHSKDSFDKLLKEGVRKSKPKHYSQMCTYGEKEGFKFSLYCAICKNTDRLYYEVVPLSFEHTAMLDDKAIKIIEARTPPTKYSENSANIVCKQCDHRGVCHLFHPVAVSCRSCRHSNADPSGEWHCDLYRIVLERDLVKTGCASFQPIG